MVRASFPKRRQLSHRNTTVYLPHSIKPIPHRITQNAIVKDYGFGIVRFCRQATRATIAAASLAISFRDRHSGFGSVQASVQSA
jgi:hypothetical protein